MRNKSGLRKAFERERAAFEKLSGENYRKPKPSHTHDLRVTTRRLRAALWTLRHGAPQKASPLFRDAEKQLKKLGTRLGDLRQLDVAHKDALKYGLGQSTIKQKRRKARRELYRFLGSKKLRRLKKSLRKVSPKLR